MSGGVIQTTVNQFPGFGVVGEFWVSSPQRVESFILNSGSAANNVFGRGFSITSQGIAAAGNSGSAIFAGILVNPKGHPLVGDGTNALNPALVLPNNVNAELCTMGSVIVNINKASAINLGDVVVYNDTTGVLTAVAPGGSLPASNHNAFAVVDYFTPTLITGTTYLGVITLTPSITPLS